MAVSSPVPIFHEAVKCVFREWQALRIIVDNMFGGPMSKEKALWLEEVTADFVCNNGKSDACCCHFYVTFSIHLTFLSA